MGILTDDMKRLIDEQKLAFHATVCPDGSPNLSPRGSTRVWDDDHLFFADICSPQTTANIRAGSPIEVNVVVIEVRHAAPLVSPAYDDGTTTEADMLESQRARFARLHER